jgi:hypothetical protein
MPSQLKEFDFPPMDFGSVCVPESLEVVTGMMPGSVESNDSDGSKIVDFVKS